MKSNDELSISGSSTNGSLATDTSSVTAQEDKQITKNKNEQQLLNQDVILSGFPVRPIHGIVVQNFLNIHSISIQNVRDYYKFENKVSRFVGNTGMEKTFYHIVISFKDKSSKSKLLKAHADLPKAIRWSQLSENNHILENPIISCRNRFSKYNCVVEKQLRNLKRSGIIAEYKFNTVLYSYKQTPVSKWEVVNVLEDLSHLTDLLEYVKVR